MIIDIVFQSGEFYGIPSSNIASVLISLASLCVAGASFYFSRKLYKNADAKKMFVKNQIEAITKMIEAMRKNFLYFTYFDAEGKLTHYKTSVRNINSFINDPKKYLPNRMDDISIYIDSQLLQALKFIDYKDDIFIPKIIADELNKFYSGLDFIAGLVPVEGAGNIIYIHQGMEGTQFANNLRNFTANYSTNNYPYNRSVKSYLNHFLVIQDKSVKWLKEYNIELNV